MADKRGALTTPLMVFMAVIVIILTSIIFYLILKSMGSLPLAVTGIEDDTELNLAMQGFLQRPLYVEKDGKMYAMSAAELIVLSAYSQPWADIAEVELLKHLRSYFGIIIQIAPKSSTLMGSIMGLQVLTSDPSRSVYVLGKYDNDACPTSHVWALMAAGKRGLAYDYATDDCGGILFEIYELPSVHGKNVYLKVYYRLRQ